VDARVRGDELESDEIKVGEMVNGIFMGRKALAPINFKRHDRALWTEKARLQEEERGWQLEISGRGRKGVYEGLERREGGGG